MSHCITGSNMSTCKACGSTFTTFEHQTRSADEAQTVVTTCPSCPVNPNKLDSTTMPLPSFRGLVRPISRRSLPVEPYRSRSRNKTYVLSFDIPSEHVYHNLDLESDYIVRRIPLHKRSISDTGAPYTTEAQHVVSGINQGMYTSFNTHTNIGIGARLIMYDTYDVSNDTRSFNVCKGKVHEVSIIRGYKSMVQHRFNENYRTLEVEIGANIPSNYTIRSIILQVYSAGIYPNNIRAYLGTDRISRFSNLGARAWDTNVPPASGHVFTSKPDGQRVWIIWFGHVWYICNPKFIGSTNRWIWSDKIRNEANVLVVDVEYVLSRGFILIDFLTSIDGSDAPVVRDIAWVLSQYERLQRYIDKIPFYPRQYFDTNEGAVQYCKRLLIPCDGTVAVRDNSTEILKVKPVKSLELSVTDDMMLVTSSGNVVMKCPDMYTFNTGDIVEVRFTVNTDMRTITVSDMFRRVDKYTVNDNTATSNIIQSSVVSTAPSDNERRVALLWCNELRRCLQHEAMNVQPTKSIILDVGTGNGQGLDAILRNDKISYVFVEPDKRSCAALARRLGIKRVYSDPWEILPLIRMLKTRSVQYIVLNCSLQDLLNHEKVYETLINEVKCVTATFSAQYVVQELQDIAASFDIPVYACTYVYDNTIDKVLIDDCGVSMRIIEDETAHIKWGGDKVYTEPVTYMRDYTGIGINMYAEQYRQLPSMSLTPGAHNICRNVMMVSPY